MIKNKHIINSLPLIASVLGRKYGVWVEIGGDKACTNGRTIYLPSLPLDSDDTLLGLVRGFIDHESAHLRETDFEVLRTASLSSLEMYIWNTLEDWRVEQILADIFPGCRHNLTWLIKQIFLNANTPGSGNPTAQAEQKRQADSGQTDNPAIHILNWLLLSVRAWDVPELAIQRDKHIVELEQFYPGLLAQLDAILQTVPNRCHSTQDCITVTREIIDILKNYLNEMPGTANPQKKQNLAKRQLQVILGSSTPILPKDLGAILSESVTGLCARSCDKLSVAVVTRKEANPLSKKDIAEARQATCALRNRLQALLQSTTLTRNRNAQHGRLDTQRLHRLSTGNVNVFKRHGQKQGLDTAVHILLDCSGSMGGSPLELAGQACFAVASALESIPGISVAVTAFPGEHTTDNGITPQNYRTVAPILRHREAMHSGFSLRASGGTPLAEALWWTLQQTQALTQKRKIILVLTDGEPDSEESAKAAIQSAQLIGCEVHGIGMGTTAIHKILPNSSRTITAISELAGAMFELLQGALLKGNS